MKSSLEILVLKEKADTIGHRTGLALGAVSYIGLMTEVIRKASSVDDALAGLIVYGIFIGPLLIGMSVYAPAAAVVSGFLQSHYMKKKKSF